MTCKQCKYIDRCMSEASFLGQVFDPDYDGEHSCREFDTFTNADRIRAMSDEELAMDYCEFLSSCLTKLGIGHIFDFDEGKSQMLRWLKQPAEVE